MSDNGCGRRGAVKLVARASSHLCLRALPIPPGAGHDAQPRVKMYLAFREVLQGDPPLPQISDLSVYNTDELEELVSGDL